MKTEFGHEQFTFLSITDDKLHSSRLLLKLLFILDRIQTARSDMFTCLICSGWKSFFSNEWNLLHFSWCRCISCGRQCTAVGPELRKNNLM